MSTSGSISICSDVWDAARQNRAALKPFGERRLSVSAFQVLRELAFAVLLISTVAMPICTAQAGEAYRLLRLDGRPAKWGLAVMGRGVILTYAVLAAPASLSGSRNCRAIKSINGLLAHSGLARKTFDREVSAAFGLWEAAADVRSRRVEHVDKADIVISAEAVPDGVSYADVTLASSHAGIVARIAKGIVCLNPAVYWMAKERGDSDSRIANIGVYQLRFTLAHEIGHVLGLDHPGPTGELMSFEYDQTIDGLRAGDIAGIVALYGSRSAVPILALNAKGLAAR
jgi:hypothetical protein